VTAPTSMEPLITLTTDFGARDPYVAAMKGVLLARCPSARVLDLTHEIAPQDVVEGALFLAAAVPYFPEGTIHLAVIDPGVGGARRGIVARVAGQVVVCPDNGLLGALALTHPLAEVHEIAAPRFMRDEVSATFHGRDVFAPAAARIATGVALADAGPSVADPVLLDLPAPERMRDGTVVARVIHLDRFGNAITNLAAGAIPAGARVVVRGEPVPLARTYGDVAAGAPLAVVGSAGLLEVAVNQGSAAHRFGLARGDEVRVAPASAG